LVSNRLLLYNLLMNQLFKYNPANRNVLIDILKGVAIILVVLGHAIQFNTISSSNNLVFKFIYLFHMPLFMFLSGYLVFGTKVFDWKFISKKFKSLVIPFLSWRVVTIVLSVLVLNLNFLNLIIRTITDPSDGGLWFLLILFFNFLLLSIAAKLAPRLNNLTLLSIILFAQLLPAGILGFALVRWHIVFFIGGYLAAKYLGLIKKNKYLTVFISLALYIILISLWYLQIPSLYNPGTLIFTLLKRINDYLLAFSSIILLFFSFNYLKNKKSLTAICWLGLYTMDIYVISNFLFYLITLFKLQINYIIAFIFVLLFSIAISLLIRNFKLPKRLLLGQYK